MFGDTKIAMFQYRLAESESFDANLSPENTFETYEYTIVSGNQA